MSETSFNDVIDMIHRYNDATSVSLPQFVKPAIIESPNFMQQSLIEEPIVGEIIKNLYNVYVGYILTALQMNDLVVGNRKVRDVLGTVSTGSYLSGSTEQFIDTESLIDGFTPATGKKLYGSQGSRQVESKNLPSIPSGRQIEVKFAAKDNKDPITVMLNVKFNTRIVPDQVIEYVIGANFKQSLSKRWLQMKAGEIRFFKDFLLQSDRLHARSEALKHDKDGAIADIFRHQNTQSMRQVFKMAVQRNRSYNLANSVLMLDEQSARKYANKSGMNFDNLRDRHKFFATTFTLFIVLVDTSYSRVTIYTNGIDQSASYSFSEMKSNANSDKLELKEVMQYLSKSQMPRY